MGSGSTASLYRILKQVAQETPPARPSPNVSPRKPKDRSVPRPLVNEPEDHEGEQELRDSLERLVLRDLVKVVPERIYCLLVHPSAEKDLVIIGDKKGHVGIWDATHAGEKPVVPNGSIRATGGQDEDEELVDAHATFWHWKAHSGTISSLRFPPLGSPNATVRRSCSDAPPHRQLTLARPLTVAPLLELVRLHRPHD